VILVDASVWIDHLRVASGVLADLLLEEQVVCHRFVVGELTCGTFKRRAEVLALMKNLREVPLVAHEEALAFVESHRLMGTGIGWVDAHLLASTVLAGQQLWTRDRPLAQVARRLGVLFTP
jgi:hypothetical protein